MDRIREVTEEFYGSLSSKKPFNSLEKLEFEDMPEWKQWHVLGNGEFPTLEKLKIKNCPELSLETPIQLSRLKSFEFIGCPKVVLFDEAQLEGMKQIELLYIDDCNSLASLPFSILPSTLKQIRICRCQKLKLEGPVGEMFLEDLRLEKCDSIDDISPELLPRARTLRVKRCHNLTRFLIPTATETLLIQNCKNVEKLSVACGNLPSAMKYLDIYGCRKLKKLPERMQELFPSLKELNLGKCPEIESFPEGGLPFNLQTLNILDCTKLVNGRNHDDGSDEDIEHWELPSSIQELTIRNLRSSQLLKSLTSLEYLSIGGNLPHIQSLLEEGQLPSSLSHLNIWNCPNLQSLSESALPSSLSHLNIWNCPNLQSLPVNGMPSSLSKLDIYNCPLLTPLLEFDKGEYWQKIAQIPSIEIDEECV